MKKEFLCRGSFRRGTACGECERCKAKGYTLAKKNLAIEETKTRDAKLPAGRIKPKNQVTIKNTEVTPK